MQLNLMLYFFYFFFTILLLLAVFLNLFFYTKIKKITSSSIFIFFFIIYFIFILFIFIFYFNNFFYFPFLNKFFIFENTPLYFNSGLKPVTELYASCDEAPAGIDDRINEIIRANDLKNTRDLSTICDQNTASELKKNTASELKNTVCNCDLNTASELKNTVKKLTVLEKYKLSTFFDNADFYTCSIYFNRDYFLDNLLNYDCYFLENENCYVCLQKTYKIEECATHFQYFPQTNKLKCIYNLEEKFGYLNI